MFLVVQCKDRELLESRTLTPVLVFTRKSREGHVFSTVTRRGNHSTLGHVLVCPPGEWSWFLRPRRCVSVDRRVHHYSDGPGPLLRVTPLVSLSTPSVDPIYPLSNVPLYTFVYFLNSYTSISPGLRTNNLLQVY